MAFGWIWLGLERVPAQHGAARATLAIGVVWLVFTLVTGVAYLSPDIDSVKGLFQRAGQVAFGAWLVVLAWIRSPE